MLITLHYETVKFVVTRCKTDNTIIYFTKLRTTNYLSFDDSAWEYWVYDTWEQMNQAWTEYYSSVFPPEDDERHYFDEEYM
jgi:hypothetical protein